MRRARRDDAEQAARLLRESIRELCAADHRHVSETLDPWLANKTTDNLERWIADPGAIMLVAECDGAMAAVDALRRDGEITLNYVAPAHRFRGVSKAMVAALVGEARSFGIDRVHLHSTATARRFYRALGFADTGPVETEHGLTSFPMAKAIGRSHSTAPDKKKPPGD